ncbi:MAG TPA: Na+/H+ antiporter [Amycolatopsis sp.]|nr:Na+/H+ antiporter [Amycolatopsis sp.]
MNIAAELVALVVTVLVVTVVARRLDWSAPLCLVAVGVAASFVPGVPEYDLDPEVVLIGLLPPLLYSASIQTSLVAFRKLRGPIATLSVGLVVFTAFGVGLVAWAVIPGLPLAAAIALGAVVAPPDAVAASVVARRVGMPRKLVRLLEGESLFNDAAALVTLRTAIAAVAGAVSAWQIGLDFVLAAVGGIVVGLAVGLLATVLRKRLDEPVTDTALSFAVPFVAYLVAEVAHGSGVLAVVVCGLMLGHQQPRILSGSARLASRLNWQTVQFLLENLVFLLIGLQLRKILEEVGKSGLSVWALVGICAAVLAATIATRVLWMGGIGVYKRITARFTAKVKIWPWRYSAVIAWAGMRGVVTLAAAFVLPADTPQRAVLVLAAFTVVAGTLVVQGMTLPSLIRRLRLPRPDPAEDALQEAAVVNDMTRAALAKLEEITTPDDPPDVIERLRDRLQYRADTAWEQLGRQSALAETPSDAYRRLRLQLLEVDREQFLLARDNGTADDTVLRRVLARLDIEESLLDHTADDTEVTVERELSTPAATARSCKHLAHPWKEVEPSAQDVCQACLDEGTTWVHLRMCLKCGNVACCDSSPRKHATRHFHDERHPVMRSFEPGETWRWCFVDKQLG